jgi:hypothetical protein
MEATIIFVMGHIVIVLAASLLLLISSIVEAPTQSLHAFYRAVAVLLLGLSIINTVIFIGLGGNVGIIDTLIAAGPTILVVLLVFSLIKKAFKSAR